jgi:ERCC4-type nuclease
MPENKLFNIFSTKETREKKKQQEEKEKPKIRVQIDYRERNSLVASELKELGLEIEFKELKVADYLVKDVAIERKTISDFINSMINRRLIKQLEELQQYPNKILIIEGIEEQELYDDKLKTGEGINANAIRGFLLSIILKYKVPIILTKDTKDTAKFIYILSKKQEKEDLPLNITKSNLTKKQRLQFILEAFPTIGPKTAKKLLKKFKTLKNIANAPEEELKEILGEKKADLFKEIINRKY